MKRESENGRMRLLKILALVGVVLVFALLISGWKLSTAGKGSLSFMIVDLGPNPAGQRKVLLQITNVGPYVVFSFDGFFVENQGPPNWTNISTTDLRLNPGEAAEIPVLLPGSTKTWRGHVTYYAESPWNQLKLRLGMSSFGPRLPMGLVSVQGAEETSPWFAQ
jgi:hypothetical protein